MKRKLTLKNYKFFVAILMVTTLFVSCSTEELPIDVDANQNSELKYNHQGKNYSADVFEVNGSLIISNSHQVYDVNDNIIYLFDTENKANEYSDSLISDSTVDVSETDETSVIKAKDLEFCKTPLLSFKVKLFSKKKFEGKSILFVVKNINVEKERKIKLKLPDFWKSKASSLIVQVSKLASTVNKNGKCRKTPPTLAAFSRDESERTRLFRTKIKNEETGKTVLRFNNLKKQEANNAIDMITIFY